MFWFLGFPVTMVGDSCQDYIVLLAHTLVRCMCWRTRDIILNISEHMRPDIVQKNNRISAVIKSQLRSSLR